MINLSTGYDETTFRYVFTLRLYFTRVNCAHRPFSEAQNVGIKMLPYISFDKNYFSINTTMSVNLSWITVLIWRQR